jgi:hypothetical protein
MNPSTTWLILQDNESLACYESFDYMVDSDSEE